MQDKILVVDDEPMQRGLLSEILSSSPDHYEVIQAGNGEQALKILQQQSVEAMLMDKRMPGMDGDTVCHKIRTELGFSLLPIIMVTGSNSPNDLEHSFSSGATDFIHKPYSPVELLARLRSAVQTKRLTDQLDTAETLLFSLARMVEAKDETTGDHCSRLSHMASEFGRILGLPARDLEALRRGGIMHDIGKLGIPDSILLKNGPLNDEEWGLMHNHTVIGAHLCEGLTSMRDVVPIILHHHERWDGSGYPYGLVGEAIPLLARIFQLVDIFDALATVRPYKNSMPLDKIINILEEETRKGWRDPDLVNEFIKIIKKDVDSFLNPKTTEPTKDEKIVQSIMETGVIAWGRKQNKHNT
ncbi:MAG: response regulator [Gammaproteobacteria bacterium]